MRRREVLKLASAALFGLPSLPLGYTSAAQSKRPKVLYYTASAGFEHSVVHQQDDRPSHSETVLTEMGKRTGFDVQCTQDGRVFDESLDQFQAIAFYTTGDLTKSNRRQTPPMTPSGKQKLLQAIADGKGFIGFHAAADTFHSQGERETIQTEVDPYIAMLGGEFVSHGKQQERSLLITSRFPGVDELGCAEGLSFTEEWYALKNFAKDLHVIMVQENDGMIETCYQRPPFPCTWARLHGEGRVFYTSLGHREDVWTNPFFQSITLGGLNWVLGNVSFKVSPNIDQVTPHANQLSGEQA